jgi:ABC-type amino acid transport substrate-binding protein
MRTDNSPQPFANFLSPMLLQPRRRFCVLTLAALSSPVRAVSSPPPPPPVIPVAHSEAVDAAFVGAVMALIGAGAGLRFEAQAVPFARMLRMAEQGEAIGFGISPSDERRRHLAFSGTLFKGAVWAVSRRDGGVVPRDARDLRGKVVCRSRQASYGVELEDPAGSGLDARQISGDLAQRGRTLSAGHCDVLLVTSRNASERALRSRLRAGGADLAALRVSRRPLVEQDVHLGVAIDSPLAALLPRVDAAMRARGQDLRRLVSSID